MSKDVDNEGDEIPYDDADPQESKDEMVTGDRLHSLVMASQRLDHFNNESDHFSPDDSPSKASANASSSPFGALMTQKGGVCLSEDVRTPTEDVLTPTERYHAKSKFPFKAQATGQEPTGHFLDPTGHFLDPTGHFLNPAGQEPSAKCQEPRAESQEPRAKSQEHKPVLMAKLKPKKVKATPKHKSSLNPPPSSPERRWRATSA